MEGDREKERAEKEREKRRNEIERWRKGRRERKR